jgi:hypothetical protein
MQPVSVVPSLYLPAAQFAQALESDEPAAGCPVPGGHLKQPVEPYAPRPALL